MAYLIRNRKENEELFTDLSETSIPNIVRNRISEILLILDKNYHDTSWDGGFVYLFLTEKSYQQEFADICNQYFLNESEWEYTEIIGGQAIDDTEWWEDLYLLTSGELSLVFIHPRHVTDNSKY